MHDGRVALVTGAARRMGRAIALALAEQGADVVVHFRSSRKDAERTADDVRALGARCLTASADLAQPDEVDSLFEKVHDEFGRLDILVNNASHLVFKPVEKLSFDEWSAGLEPLTATFLCSQRALGVMPSGGRIINIGDSSAERVRAAPLDTPYRIGKTGIAILTKSFAEQAAPRGITVNMISPGTLEDSQTKPDLADMPAGRYATYADITHALRCLLDPGSGYICGANIKVTGGWDL